MYLLVGAAERWGGWRGHAYPCVVLGYAVLCYGVGVGVGVMRISGRRFVALLAWRVSKDKRFRIYSGLAAVVFGGVGGVFVGVGTLDCCMLQVVSMWHQNGVVCRACGCNAVVGP